MGMAHKAHDSVAEKFADMAIRIWKGDRSVVDDIKRILPDSEIVESKYGFVGSGPNGMAVGIQYGLDPVNALVQIGFLYAGMAWPFLDFFHEANKIARKMWREEVKKAKMRAEAHV
jgi:hypothetical protein